MEAQDRELVEVALDAARAAASLHREEAGHLAPERWSEKGTSDFVTEVDIAAERLIVDRLRTRYPDHVFLAEEETEPGEWAAPVRWIIDPLDGTTNWLHGYPEYAVSIAALDPDGIRVGVVLQSVTGDEYVAVRDQGSRCNGAPIHTSELAEIRLALLGTGFPFKRVEMLPSYLAMLGRTLQGSSGVRRAGAAALDLCAVATGRLDAFWELWLMPWDVAAGALIVREAGGTFEGLELAGDLEAAGDPAVAGDPEAAGGLSAAMSAGRRFVTVLEGGAGPVETAGAAYMASNGPLRSELVGLLSG